MPEVVTQSPPGGLRAERVVRDFVETRPFVAFRPASSGDAG